MKLILPLFLLLTCCYYGDIPRPTNQLGDRPEDATKTLEYVILLWEGELGEEVRGLPELEFYEGECLYFKKDYGRSCILGLYSEQSDIIELVTAPEWVDALCHESLHWILEQLNGDMDAFMKRPEWDLVPNVRFELLTTYGL